LGAPMFGFAKDFKHIQVLFFEVGAVKPFAQSELPVEQLPDTFQIETTLHIGNDDWMVSEAIPSSKAEFRKTGKVTIRLFKPTKLTVPPSTILYSLPTITDDAPALVNAPSLENVLVVHEDDWRQVELVSATDVQAVQSEVASVRQILDTQRVANSGYRSIHVRKLIPEPLLSVSLSLVDLKRAFGTSHEYTGVAFSKAAAIIVGGFAFRSSNGWIVWGQSKPDGTILAACFRLEQGPNPATDAGLATLLSSRQLLFVDWTHLVVLPRAAK